MALRATSGSGGGGGSGTVTTVSVTSANGLAGTVANDSTTPAITLSTSVTGVLKGNGTAISAATAGTDYQAPISLTTTGTSGAATFAGNVLNIPQYSGGGGGGTVTSVAQSFTGGIVSVAGSPVTTSGTLALTVAGTSGGIPYFSSGTTWATSAALASNALVVGGGAGAAPATVTTGTGVVTALGVNTGSAGAFVVNGGALGTPSSGTVTNLTGTASININGTVGATTPTTGVFTTAKAIAAATQDSVTLQGRAGGTSSYGVTLTPTTLTASRTLTLPDATGTLLISGGDLGTPSAGVVTNLTGTASININGTVGATTPTTGVFTTSTARAAATQDSVILQGRAGGTSSYGVTLTPTTLTASRTLTLPDASGTILQSGTTVTTAQGGTGLTSFTSGGAVYATSASALTTGTLPTTAGGTGLTSFTANGVAYASSTSALTTGSALTFDGTNFVTTGSATGTAFIPSGSTVPTNGMYLPAANTVAWSTATSERMRIDSSGNVGIGSNSPTSAFGATRYLEIKNAIDGEFAINSNDIYKGAFGVGNQGAFFGTSTNHNIRFLQNSTERMRFDTAGNIGIGTTGPSASAILDVQSTTKGLRMPNMTTTQKNAISSPVAGLVVFDTTLAKLCVYSGSAWQTVTSV